MPVTAECTISTRAPPARRSATMRAMLLQLARVETLVPPNFRTIQAEGAVTDLVSPGAQIPASAPGTRMIVAAAR